MRSCDRSFGNGWNVVACVASVMVVHALGVGVWLVLRWRAGAAEWPGVSGAGLSREPAILGLVALAFATWLVRPRGWAQEGHGWVGRGAAILASALVLLALAACLWSCLTLSHAGIVLWQPRATLYPAADIYYLHAVKIRLGQLQAELEQRQQVSVGDARGEDDRRLALVGVLQSSLVGWTEREVGHWLDDTPQRRSLLELAAFQIHAGAQSRNRMQERAAQERTELTRRRVWFSVLRAFCIQRLATQPARGAGATSDTATADVAEPDPAGAAETERSSAQEASTRELTRDLKQVGADAWSFALTVVQDAADPAMVAEYLNQIDASLQQMAARNAFVDEHLEPMWGAPAAPGLNQRYPWLRLPVCFPHARAWAGGFALLTLTQMVLLLLLLLLLTLILARTCARRGATDHGAAAGIWCWACAATVVASVNFVLLYVA